MRTIRISVARSLWCACLMFVLLGARGLHAQVVTLDPCDPFTKPYADQPPEMWGGVDTIFWYALAPFRLTVPTYGEWSAIRVDPPFVLQGDVYYTPNGAGILNACADYQRGKEVAEKCWTVLFLEPKLALRERTRALKGIVGSLYDPQTDWVDRQIPNSMYQTIVEFDGVTIIDRPGTNFERTSLPKEMMITPDVHEIRTSVYWRPGGTQDRSQWKLIFANYEDPAAYISPSKLGTKFTISYPPLFHAEGFSFEATFSTAVPRHTVGPILFHQFPGSLLKASDRSVTVTCSGCAEAGIEYAVDNKSDSLFIDLDLIDPRLLRRSTPATLTFFFTVKGQGGIASSEEVEVKAVLKSDR